MNWLGECVLSGRDECVLGESVVSMNAYRSLSRVFPGVRDVITTQSGGTLLQARHESLCKHCFRHDEDVSWSVSAV